MEKCNDCVSVKNINETVNRFLSKLDNHEERIAKLERTSDVIWEKLSNIDKTLTKIDGGIESIGKQMVDLDSRLNNKIENVDKKPSVFMDKILSAVSGGVITFIVIEIVKAIR